MPSRAPWPHKQRADVARSLRESLAMSWSLSRHRNSREAYAVLEAAVMFAVCDLEAWTVEGWEGIRAELEAGQPK
jgi:hypothetical protein